MHSEFDSAENVSQAASSTDSPRFADLGLVSDLLSALEAEGYTTPTPIQVSAIPPALAGRDLLGIAQTGTGKTAAFALPILQRLAAVPRAARPAIRCLVLAPTRELAAQIDESFAAYGRKTGLTHTVIFGGVGQNSQTRELARGIDVLVATPGRLLDLLNQRLVSLASVEYLVLDEADRMLDMGFLPDVRRVLAAVPKKRQTMFFSATMPPEVATLAAGILVDPIRVEVTPVAATADRVEQRVYFVERNDKKTLLLHLLRSPEVRRALVFTRTKHTANRVAEQLERAGVRAAAIHGNKSQGARERALEGFRDGTTPILVATDIAARGIDVDDVTHVVNFELPNVPETYVHRIGRTARAGREGIALSLCEVDERPFLVDIERLIKAHVPRVADHPYPSNLPEPQPTRLDGGRSPTTSAPSRGGSRPQQQRGERGGRPQQRQQQGGDRGGRAQQHGGRPAQASSGRPSPGRPQQQGSAQRPQQAPQQPRRPSFGEHRGADHSAPTETSNGRIQGWAGGKPRLSRPT